MRKISVVLQDGSTFTGAGPEQLFHFTPAGGREMVFCIPRMVEMRRQFPERWPTLVLPVDGEGATAIFLRGSINEKRLRQMTHVKRQLPGFGVFMEDGSFLVVDGNHRYFSRWQLGFDSMRFHTAWPPDWHPALLDIEATKRLMKGQTP